MQKYLSLLSIAALTAFFCAGCAGPEEKAGRGFANMIEITRLGEFEHAEEIDATFGGPTTGMFTGFFRGVDHTLERTGLGIYEVITFPIPPYHPILTDYVSERPSFTDSYRPRKWADSMFNDDQLIGFSGGDVAPWFPGSRFRIFDN